MYGIKAYLSSIFLNLLTNGLKYRNTKKKLIIKIKAESNKATTTISFQDNGIGINLEKHGAKLFGMYKTFHGNKDAKGVGLFISKNQMDVMNGEIKVDSKEGRGATFSLLFPNNKKSNS